MSNFPRRNTPDVKDRKRLVFIAFFVFFLFTLLIIQFYRIQIIQGDKWLKKALAQHQTTVTEPGKRGLFYSNTSIKLGHPEYLQPFVIDVSKFHLYVDPESIPPHLKEAVVQNLAGFLQLKDKQAIRTNLSKKSRSRKLAAWLDKDVRDQIEDWWKVFSIKQKVPRNAVFFIEDYKRSYPFGKLLGQVLHTVRDDKNAQTGQNIPTGGWNYSLTLTCKVRKESVFFSALQDILWTSVKFCRFLKTGLMFF